MRTHDGSPMKKALPMLLGLALSSWAGSLPAFAQDSVPADTTIKDEVLSDQTAQEMFGEEAMKNPEAIPDPMPLSYPEAAPGSLHMRHWTDYTKFESRPGSVSDVRFYKDKMLRIDLDENGRVKRRTTPLYYRRLDSGDQGTTTIDQTNLYSDTNGWWRPSSMTASGDFVYIVRGDTLYQLRSSDMSVATQKDLPMMSLSSPSAAPDANQNSSATGTTPTSTYSRMRMRVPTSVSVSGDYLYVLRGDTLYQFRTADLSLVSQKELTSMHLSSPSTQTPDQAAPSVTPSPSAPAPNSPDTGTPDTNPSAPEKNSPGTDTDGADH